MRQHSGTRLAERVLTLALAVLLFLAGFQGGRAVLALPDWQAESWQQTDEFNYLMDRQMDNLMNLINSTVQLEDPEGTLPYLERERLKESIKAQKTQLDPEKSTWFRFRVKSVDGENLYYDNMNGEVQTIHYTAFELGSRTPGMGIVSLEGEKLAYEQIGYELNGKTGTYVVIEYGVPDQPSNLLVDDFCKLYHRSVTARTGFPGYVQSTVGILVAAAVCLLAILILAGKRAVGPEGELDWKDQLSLEPFLLTFLLISGLSTIGMLWLGKFGLYHSAVDWNAQILPVLPWMMGALGLVSVGGAALFLRTLILRLVTRSLVNNTWICRSLRFMYHGLGVVCHALPIMWRVLLVVLAMVASDVLAVALYVDYWTWWPGAIIWALVHAGALAYLCRWAVGFRRLREGAKTIVGGNLAYQIDTAHMPRALAAHSEDLNNISRGMSEAVDEKMKSERFKAELITNVSHDLKTPLTSIINYVSLLKTTQQSDPKALEYIEVLERKSNRLKKLTEDLVEASKASTGVLNVQLERISMNQLLDQALAEWQDKLNDRDLTVVASAPEGELWVHADGRHLWRVIDNLLANCCKYAMEGTRIYLDLIRDKGQVVLSVKNVSREQLNVPVERLMERFVRGEESRSTEGSGLGLSIARSLTELQGGEFRLSVDGDLFKAVVSLPQAT